MSGNQAEKWQKTITLPRISKRSISIKRVHSTSSFKRKMQIKLRCIITTPYSPMEITDNTKSGWVCGLISTLKLYPYNLCTFMYVCYILRKCSLKIIAHSR